MSRKLFLSMSAALCLCGLPAYGGQSPKDPPKTVDQTAMDQSSVKKPKATTEAAENHGRFRHWIRTLRYGYDPYLYDPYFSGGFDPYGYYPYGRPFYYGYPRYRSHIYRHGGIGGY